MSAVEKEFKVSKASYTISSAKIWYDAKKKSIIMTTLSAWCLFFKLSLILTLLLCVRLERAPPKLVHNHAYFFMHCITDLQRCLKSILLLYIMEIFSFELFPSRYFSETTKQSGHTFFFLSFFLNSWFKSFSVHHVYGTMLFSFHTGLESDSRHTSHTATALSCKGNLYL